MDKTGIAIIDKYVNFYFRSLRLDGWNVAREDIASELSFAYAKALDAKSSGQFSQGGTAKFETYVVCAFKNQISDYVKSLGDQCAEVAQRVDFDVECLIDEDGCFKTQEMILVAKEAKALLLNGLNDRDLLIAKEMIEPSEAIVAIMNENNKARCKVIPENLTRGKGTGSLAKAIARQHGLTERQVRYGMEKIKNKAKKVLTY